MVAVLIPVAVGGFDGCGGDFVEIGGFSDAAFGDGGEPEGFGGITGAGEAGCAESDFRVQLDDLIAEGEGPVEDGEAVGVVVEVFHVGLDAGFHGFLTHVSASQANRVMGVFLEKDVEVFADEDRAVILSGEGMVDVVVFLGVADGLFDFL